MGDCTLPYYEIEEIIDELKIDYIGSSYNLIHKNCNNFTDEFLQRLLKKKQPSYVNRIARLS